MAPCASLKRLRRKSHPSTDDGIGVGVRFSSLQRAAAPGDPRREAHAAADDVSICSRRAKQGKREGDSSPPHELVFL